MKLKSEPQKYKCFMPRHGGEASAKEEEAWSPDAAAEWFASHVYDECDGWEFMPNCEVDVVVIHPDGRRQTFEVLTEFEPRFWATEK